MRCINVERDEDCFKELEINLAPWQEVAVNFQGEFAEHLDVILETVDNDPALVFLDPFGVNGIEMDIIEKILSRAGKTELLVHFSDKMFMRMAGHIGPNDERLAVGRKVGESKLSRLDAVIGNPMWRRLWTGSVDTYAAMEKTAELYLSELRTRIRYAHQIPIRDTYIDRPAYRLVFCTNSPHGVELMSDRARRYETALKDKQEAGAMTLWADEEEREHLTDLRDSVHVAGVRKGCATRDEIVHELAPMLFGKYTSTDYAKVIRELVSMRLIQRADAVGIEPREALKFVEPAQGSLLSS